MKTEPASHKFLPAFVSLTFLLSLFIPQANAELTNFMEADIVLGHAGFNSGTQDEGGISARSIDKSSRAIVVGEKLIVLDSDNSRILIYNTIPTTNHTAADVVIGQADFVSGGADPGGNTARGYRFPFAMGSDGQRLYISDRTNNRVMIFNNIPTTNFAPADVVVGQSVFTADSANQGGTPAANTIDGPRGNFYDGKRFFIADSDNNRVLIYNQIPTANNASADVVIGQPDFSSVAANQGGTPGANTLDSPRGLYSDGTRLIVGDHDNNRLLIFNKIPTENDASADIVLGQADFTGSDANRGGGPTANTFSLPKGIHSDGQKLFVTDTSNNRVLVWNQIPTKSGQPADVVIGQTNFTSGTAGTSSRRLSGVRGVFFSGKQLFTSEGGNNRVLIFNIGGSGFDLGPQFTQGKSVLGKVFWDFNKSGRQDTGEYGVEGVKVVSDTGIYAITDEDGKYHYPFIQVGQRILKLDPITLPVGATVTTENPRKVIVTEGILTKVSFGLYSDVREVEISEDDDLLLKVSIAQDPSKLAPQLSVSAETTQDKIVFTINTNYHLFIKRAELKLFDQNQNLLQTIDLPQPLPLHYEVSANDAVAFFQLSVYDGEGHEDRTSLAQISPNAS